MRWRARPSALLAGALAVAVASARAQGVDSIPSPLTLFGRSAGEPSWAATLRLREAESRYRSDPRWRSTYCQLRAQSEVWLGDHAAALREIGSCWGTPDASVYSVPAGARAVDALTLIAAAADTARIVMVNERHHAASDRLLTLRLLSLLRQKGYRYFAAEAFDGRDSSLDRRAYAASGVTGGYVDEPVFGEIVREARRLGYTLVPYEMEPAQDVSTDSLNPQQRRDRAQARNLDDRIFRVDSRAKVLVHAGYSHIKEHADSGWSPMAAYLRELTGMDPVTVDQTVLSEMSEPAKEHRAYRALQTARLVGRAPVILVDRGGRAIAPSPFDVDFQVVSPRTTYVHGRPSWMTLGGRRRAVTLVVPECVQRHCVIEARLGSDADAAVPLDRAEARTGSVTLFLPPNEPTRIRVRSTTGEVLRTIER